MRSPLAAVLAALVTVLTLAGCGGSGSAPRLGAPNNSGQDINPRDPATLRDGGDLRLPLDYLPVNYNYNQVDGHDEVTHEVTSALMPRAFSDAPDGGVALDTDFVTAAELTSTNPQVVHYHVNDRAVWSSGRPITWEDFAAQAAAESGRNPAYLLGDRTGYQDIAKVERGATDKDVLVTFARTYSEWQGLFYGLYPKETDADPAVFNTGWLRAPLVTAGPFRVGAVDPVGKTITLVRNERWWGDKPRLDRVIFTVTDRNALADRLANNEIDLYEIGSSVDLFRRAQTIPGVQIRQATPKQFTQITVNGSPGAVLEDLKLRQAIARGIDRTAIARTLVGQIVPNVVTMGNHIYPYGSKDYRDNSAVLPFDPVEANRELDALGWTRPAPDAVRAKDGRPLALRYLTPAGNPVSDAIAKVVLDQLSRLGARVEIVAVPTSQFFADYVNKGNFDLAGYQYVSSSEPFSDSVNVYQEPKGSDLGINFGRVYDPRLGALYARGFAELDPAKRAEIGNQIDRVIWEEVHDLPLYPQTGAFAVRAKLANFGAKGLGDWDFVRAGFVR